MASKKLIICVVLLLLILFFSSAGRFNFSSTAALQAKPSFIELGYGPGYLESVENGIPVYAPGDSMWLLSTSGEVSSVQLVSPKGVTESFRGVTGSTVYDLYQFTASDVEGNWSLVVTLANSSAFSLQIPFVNPAAHPIGLSLSNYSLGAGSVNLNFAVSSNNAFNVQTCLASSDVNSTIVVPVPAKFGGGDMSLIGGTHSVELSFEGSVTSPFTFMFEMDYSYSYQGSLKGEYISRDVSVFKSNTVVITSSNPTLLQISNYTSPRFGRYTMNAYFDNSNGVEVEQTTALLLNGLNWIWIGGCGTNQVNTLTFSSSHSLQGDILSWPTSLLYMYEIDGVDTYARIPVLLNLARVDFIGSLNFSNLYYLGYTIAQNEKIDQSSIYDGSLFLIGKSFPLSFQVTPNFGSSNLTTQNMTVMEPYTIESDVIGVGDVNASITNNTVPLSGASMVADNGLGGSLSSTSNTRGLALLTLPIGTYNVTVTTGGQSLTQRVSVTTDGKTVLQFNFTSTPPALDTSEYILISLVVIGFLADIVLWLRPRR